MPCILGQNCVASYIVNIAQLIFKALKYIYSKYAYIPGHVALDFEYYFLNIATLLTVGVTKKSPQGKAILKCLDEPVVGEVEIRGRREIVLIHYIENEKKKRTSGWSRGGVDSVS